MEPIVFKNISELMWGMGMPKPLHPLVALVNYDVTRISRENAGRSFLIDFTRFLLRKISAARSNTARVITTLKKAAWPS